MSRYENKTKNLQMLSSQSKNYIGKAYLAQVIIQVITPEVENSEGMMITE